MGDELAELPMGTVTFLFTDLEGSTRLWEAHPEAMKSSLARHDEILRDAVEGHGGYVVKTTGDGLHAAFQLPADAVAAAMAGQRASASEPWAISEPLRVRMGIHTGVVEDRDGDYFGSAVNRAARVMGVAHGGQVLVSQTSQELLRDSLDGELGLVDLGEHRLRDLSRAERLFQLTGPGLEREFGPVRSIDAFPGNLPLQLTSFIGRHDELEQILAELATVRVLTLTGVGGVGKTRLALQIAAEALPRFADGAWLIELGPIGDPDAVVEVATATLGIQQHQGRTLAESLVEALRTKEMLLVIDNCEHLLDASAALVTDLVRSCPNVRVLATSREALEVPGEQSRRVPSLPLPAKAPSADELASSEAVRLFVERAREVRHGFALDAETAGPVAQICRRLDGIPLAIELAAARVTSMQPNDIANRLDERFRLLTGGRRTVVERHQTLRATVDWSYELLSDAEQRVFDRLGVFAGGFTLEAAEAVVADENHAAADVVDILDTLVARSMVALDETATQTRYELLETMRQYARERLDATEVADAVRARHAGYFLSFAQSAEPELLGPDEPAWVRRVEADLDNLRAAFTWAADSGDLDVALGIPAAFWWQAQNIPSWGSGRWGEEAASLVGMEEHPLARSVLGIAIYSLCNHGDVGAAAECWQRVLEVERKLDLQPDYQSRLAQASAAAYADRVVEAKELMEQAVAAADRDGDEAVRVTSRGTLAIFQWMSGEHQAAIELAENVLRGARSMGSPTLTSFGLYSLAYTLQDDDPSRAVACLREQVAASGQLRWDAMTGLCWMMLCRVEANHGDPTAAIESARAAIRHFVETGYRIQAAMTIKISATAFRRAGHPAVAAILLGWVDQQPQRGTAGEEGDLYERQQAETRDDLGADEYDTLAARGAAMSYDEIVGYALQQADLLIPEPTTS